MIELPYSLMIEATEEPDYFGFYSTDLKGFSGIGHSVEDCLFKAKWGIRNTLNCLKIKDSQSGMWAFRRSILDTLVLRSDNAPLSQELKIEACHFAKCRWREVPIRYKPRVAKPKLGGWGVGFENLLHLFKKRIAR